jgi:hypothetical protein
MSAAGRLLARNGDTMNAFISPALDDAADLLALARPDDDGAPPAVSPPQPADRRLRDGSGQQGRLTRLQPRLGGDAR